MLTKLGLVTKRMESLENKMDEKIEALSISHPITYYQNPREPTSLRMSYKYEYEYNGAYTSKSGSDRYSHLNTSRIGPFMEGAQLTLRCESSGGIPVAKVSWWRNETKLIEGNYSIMIDD